MSNHQARITSNSHGHHALIVRIDRDYLPLPEDLEWVAALNESLAEACEAIGAEVAA